MAKNLSICIICIICLNLLMAKFETKPLMSWAWRHKKTPRTVPIDVDAAKTMDENQDVLAKEQATTDINDYYGDDIVNEGTIIDETIENATKIDNVLTNIPKPGTPERKAYYDSKNWAYDDTIKIYDPLIDEIQKGADIVQEAMDIQSQEYSEELDENGVSIETPGVVESKPYEYKKGFSAKADNYLRSQYARISMLKDLKVSKGGTNYSQLDIPNYSQFKENMEDLAHRTAGAESTYGKYLFNPKSTARGIYHHIQETAESIPQKLLNTGSNENYDLSYDPNDWTKDESDVAFLANMFSAPGSDKVLAVEDLNKLSKKEEAYKRFHHTIPKGQKDVDDKIQANIDVYFK